MHEFLKTIDRSGKKRYLKNEKSNPFYRMFVPLLKKKTYQNRIIFKLTIPT
ncbi:hypothetical protein LEP1GSC052_3084 [Leptospira kmetyi serovar Malaysia str. Bejo-Iso9]|nr:hypothetical protein LEP1GSC052_3084 [Leptospira kmetyi serovar Malaysia str. Bejo-Iso9]